LLAGEQDAFERFVDHFRSKVFHYSWLMCGRPEDAEEVAQETLLKVFENIEQLREPARVRPWVFRIAKNACLMQRRRSLFAPAPDVSIDELPPGTDLADRCAASRSPAARFRTARGARPGDRRIASDVPGCGPTARSGAIVDRRDGANLELGTDVVKQRLHRGRAAMRQKLDCYVHNHCLEDQPSPIPRPLQLRSGQSCSRSGD